MEDCAIAASPEMQMKQEEEEQLEDCKAMNADWTIIQSRRQQKEERQQKEGRHQGGKESNASNCQQSRSPTKSRRPRRHRRFRSTLTPEEWVDYTEKGNLLRTSGLPERKASLPLVKTMSQAPHSHPLPGSILPQ